MKFKIEIKQKYVYGFLVIVHVWAAFFIGSLMGFSNDTILWYQIPYVITCMFVLIYLMVKAMNTMMDDY